MRKQTGGPAFPVERHVAHALALKNVGSEDEKKYIAEVNKLCGGMTLRDYFAAKAMLGDWSAQDENTGYWEEPDSTALELRATVYYRMADAMLKARES
ncbi:hypothetical protein [Pectobacterium sp. 21LCBS03]|uniref:hypothetical protein n=1 Tax=Pectobacterium sp. 21LCBS03 TaxID=2935858 RepID=UPI00200F8781|nr:hypothetical protein [Pectobacterium sp. 21LCBS03]UPY96242.1 hypothetical protein MYB54_05920 [Pectobacterium sp. 21LCBS03]